MICPSEKPYCKGMMLVERGSEAPLAALDVDAAADEDVVEDDAGAAEDDDDDEAAGARASTTRALLRRCSWSGLI